MIDSISFLLPAGSGIPVETLAEGGRLKTPAPNATYWKNFRLRHTEKGLLVSGSIGKYLNGENVSYLSRQGVQASFEKLEDETGWNLSNANLLVAEVGACFAMKESASSYMQSMEYKPMHKKMVYSSSKGNLETVLFFQDEKSFQFYDKNQEGKDSIPAMMKGHNLLRLEYKIKGKLAKRIGMVLSVKDLQKRSIYEKFIEQWGNEYFDVQKKRIPIISNADITPKELEKILASYAVSELGIEAVQSIIQNKNMDAKTKLRIKYMIHELNHNNSMTETSSLIDELNWKVQQVLTAKE
jgi:hypothetical protein